MIGRTFPLVLTLALGAPGARAASPFALSYSGRLTDAAGGPAAGPVELSLKFYDAAIGGNQLGAVDDQQVALSNGVFQAPIALDGSTFQQIFGGGGQVYVEITDVTHAKTYPRQIFNAVPYALRVPVDGSSVKFDGNGVLTVPAAPAPPAANATQAGFLSTSDWAQFNAAPPKAYIDGLNAAQTTTVAGLSTSLVTTNVNLATTNTNVTAITSAALKKDGSVPLTAAWNVGNQDVTNTGNLLMTGSKVLGLSVATSDPGGLGAGDTGKIWYNGGIRLWNGTSAQSLGIAGGGIQSLNGLNGTAQSLAYGTAGTAPNWVPAGSTHTFNIPLADAGGAVTAGLISNAEWALFNGKQNVLPAANAVTNGYLAGGDWTLFNAKQPLLPPASLTANGYLASGDWAVFNAKQTVLGAATGGGLGYLTAGDWTAFNGKDPFVTAGTTTQYYRGDKTWQTLNTTNVTEAGSLYYTTARAQADARSAIGASGPLQYSAGTGAVSLPPATFTANGYLASGDWATFNAKQPALAAATAGGSGFLASSDWAVFNAKVNVAGDTMTGPLTLPANGLAVGSSQLRAVNGNVGIGTTGPAVPLDVYSATLPTPFRVNSGQTGSYINFSANSASQGYFGYTSSGSGGLSFLNAAGNTVNLIVTNAGNVGIGSTMPGQLLSVAGTIESTAGGFKFPDGTTQATGAGAAYASVYRTAAYSFGVVATWYDVPFDQELSKATVVHSNSTNPERLQVTAAGTYRISYSVNHLSSGGGSLFLRLVKNDAAEIAGTFHTSAPIANGTLVAADNVIVALAANDYVTLQAGTNNIASITVDSRTGDGPAPTTATRASFSIERIH